MVPVPQDREQVPLAQVVQAPLVAVGSYGYLLQYLQNYTFIN